jgi:hypothetical protein
LFTRPPVKDQEGQRKRKDVGEAGKKVRASVTSATGVADGHLRVLTTSGFPLFSPIKRAHTSGALISGEALQPGKVPPRIHTKEVPHFRGGPSATKCTSPQGQPFIQKRFLTSGAAHRPQNVPHLRAAIHPKEVPHFRAALH